jgi:hypothetical protein
MEVIRTIKPGMPGSRRFQKHWGQNLVAVRYRRDLNKLYTTIEIIVDEREQADPSISLKAVHAYRRQQLVAVTIAFEEQALRATAKSNGARWSVAGRAWVMPYNTAVALGLRSRIVEGLAEKCTDVELYSG